MILYNNQEMKLEILQKEKEEWSSKYKQLLRTIDELETTAKEAVSIMCEQICEPATRPP
jgi:hypothetical protein